jgi:predicted transcriptional regulator
MIADDQRRTSQIVAAYVRKNLIPTDQIAGLINSVHSTLSGLGNEVVEEPPRVPAVTVRRSVRPDHIICIDCGYKGKMLKRHLQSKHGLSVIQYKLRWKLPSDYPMTAPNYSERRSQFAKGFGLGRRPASIPAATPASEAKPEKPAPRRATSKAAKTRTSAKTGRPKKTNSRTSATKAITPRSSAKKASPRTSPKKAGRRSLSRKSSSRAMNKAASARNAVTA